MSAYLDNIGLIGDKHIPSLKAIIRWAKMFDRPIQGKGAWRVWQGLSSSYHYKTSDSIETYIAAGYKPFNGYPLQRI